MGSPLGPLFANIFLFFHKTTWLNNCPTNCKPLLYRRYVDDTFLLFRSRDHIPLLVKLNPIVNFPSLTLLLHNSLSLTLLLL
jgi:hypothetical protein